MGKGMIWTIGLISVFGLAVACSSHSNHSAKASGVVAQSPATPSPNMAADHQLLRTQSSSGDIDNTKSNIKSLDQNPQAKSISVVPDACTENSLRCDVVQMMEIQRESHIVLNQAWAAVWKENSTTIVQEIGTVFKTTLSYFKQMYRSDGSTVSQSATCVGAKANLENLSTKIQTRYVLSTSDCQQSNRRWELVTFEKLGSKHWRLTYATSNFPASALGSSLQFLGKPVVCNVVLNDSMKVSKLNCTGLGQNRNSDEYAEFTKFAFSKTDQSYLLQIKGSKYRTIQDKAGDFDVLVPVDGPILYQEKVIAVASAQPVVETQVQQVVPMAAPAVPTAANTAAGPVAETPVLDASGRPQLRKRISHNPEKTETAELLQMLNPDDRQQYDLMKPEEQQQVLEELRLEKQSEQNTNPAGQQAGQELDQQPNVAPAAPAASPAEEAAVPEAEAPEATPAMSIR